MFRTAFAAALMLGATIAQAATETTEVAGGTGARAVTLSYSGAIGQSFTANTTDLSSFGFQFEALNPANSNDSITFTLRNGAGLAGSVVTSRTFTLPASINSRTATWFDIALTNTLLTAGSIYTAVLSNAGSSYRNAVVYGPDLYVGGPFNGQPKTGDAYADGRLYVGNVNTVGTQCNSGICDLNFRMTGTAVAPVPEPGEWAMMAAGLGVVGMVARRRKRGVAA